MKIGLLRHFPVDHLFLKGFVKQSQVLQWFEKYNEAAVRHMEVEFDTTWQVCYSSLLPRARQTAASIFQGDVICTELLNEPSPDPLFKRDVSLPFLLWALLIRLAILSNHASQSQRKEVIESRVRKLIPELLCHGDANVLIVSHAFVIEILSDLLLKEGFSGRRINRPKHGLLYTFERP
jgi:hypothetical protein